LAIGRAAPAVPCETALSATNPEADITTWGNPEVDHLGRKSALKSAQNLSFSTFFST
jgi:hypothetical protein